MLIKASAFERGPGLEIGTVNLPKSLSHTGSYAHQSSQSSQDQGLETSKTNLPIRCLIMACAHQSSQSSEDQALETGTINLPVRCLTRAFCPSNLAVERGPGLEIGTVNLPVRCLILPYAHQSSHSSEDQASRLAPSISQIAVSYWLLCSSKLAVEPGPGLETSTTNLPIRCLTLACAHQSSQSSEDQASRLAPSISQFAVSHWLLPIKSRSRVRTRPRDWHRSTSQFAVSHWLMLFKSSQSSQDQASRLAPVNLPIRCLTLALCSSKLASEPGPGLETGTVNLPIRCLTLAYAHQSSQSSEDQGLESGTVNLSNSLSPHWILLIKARRRAKTRPRDWHRQSFQFAVSHWLMLIKTRSRARTRPRDWHRQSSNSLSHTGWCSPKLAVERRPSLETGTVNLPIRCLTLAHARKSSQSSEDQASRLAPSMFQFTVSHWLMLIKARSRAKTRPRDWVFRISSHLSVPRLLVCRVLGCERLSQTPSQS